jgi:hypothetical protein
MHAGGEVQEQPVFNFVRVSIGKGKKQSDTQHDTNPPPEGLVAGARIKT